MELVGGHFVVEHEVDGRGDVGEKGLPEGRGVSQVRCLGDLQNSHFKKGKYTAAAADATESVFTTKISLLTLHQHYSSNSIILHAWQT
jgi:hypothetical protein